MYQYYLKPFTNKAIAGILLLTLSPLLLVLSTIQLFCHRKVIFRQERAGKGGRSFTLYKFRSMTEKRDISGELLPDPLRITPWGKFLRSTSMDELPQLINVLKGDMYLVGPRPLPLTYNNLYSRDQKKRLNVKPGMTGLVQVSGRNSLSWNERFELDLKYIEKQSLLLDIKILFLTFFRIFIFRKQDVFSEKFTG